ncbi:alpha/beta fold hydrolase [Aerolutibacter ruishenii]|nr:alpha/beta fold hydrolase [Lysobacter ruishenii]
MSRAHDDLWIDTADGRLFARRWHSALPAPSARAPLVLFHDSLGCVALWREFPQQLADVTGRELIAYDRLGFGQSDPHPGRLERGFVHDEATGGFGAVHAQLGLDGFVAFGHSVGGGMAIATAAAHPDACRALVTEAAQAFVEDRTRTGILAARTAFAAPGQLERLARYHGDKAAWVLHAWIDTWLADDFADWQLDDALGQVRCPALVLHGDQDEYGSTAHPQRIGARLGDAACVHLLPGVGHVPHRERADAVLALVSGWLAEHAR